MSRGAQIESAIERAKQRIAHHDRRARRFAEQPMTAESRRNHVAELADLKRAEADLAWFEGQLHRFVAGVDL